MSREMSHLELVALVVRDYDAAIDFFVNVLQFELVEDGPAVHVISAGLLVRDRLFRTNNLQQQPPPTDPSGSLFRTPPRQTFAPSSNEADRRTDSRPNVPRTSGHSASDGRLIAPRPSLYSGGGTK
jgi:catechol 2,3-dioxygenase-like lactoylglutathione lyase family enzyme